MRKDIAKALKTAHKRFIGNGKLCQPVLPVPAVDAVAEDGDAVYLCKHTRWIVNKTATLHLRRRVMAKAWNNALKDALATDARSTITVLYLRSFCFCPEESQTSCSLFWMLQHVTLMTHKSRLVTCTGWLFLREAAVKPRRDGPSLLSAPGSKISRRLLCVGV